MAYWGECGFQEAWADKEQLAGGELQLACCHAKQSSCGTTRLLFLENDNPGYLGTSQTVFIPASFLSIAWQHQSDGHLSI